MDTAVLRVFLDVVRRGGFAAVARTSNVDPSSISRAIAALESELGARLFQRTTRKLTLTEAGESFLARVGPVVDELERAREEQVVRFLGERIDFEIPPTLLKRETRSTLAELVQRNRERGVPDEMMKEKEEELIRMAGGLAAHRLKTNFILHRIAEVEKIQVTRADLDERLRHQAMHQNVTPAKLREEIEKHDGMNGLVEQVLLSKTIDFLGSNATIEGAPATAVPEGAQEAK